MQVFVVENEVKDIMVQICPFCENGVEITEIKSYPDYRRRFFSCGHIDKPAEENINVHIYGKTDLARRMSGVADREDTIDISPITAIVLSRLKHSKKVKIKEKTVGGKRCLQFSAESIRLAITNEDINIHLLETKFSENIFPKDILESISVLTNEVRTNSIIKDRERKKILSLFERLNNVLASQPKRTIFGGKWTFSLATPYILKIIEILTGSSTDNYNSNANNKRNTKKTPV